MLKEIPAEYMESFETTMKVGLIATITPDGMPHISLISSIQGNGPKQVIWGQFIDGMSKTNVKTNPKTAFLIMDLNREIWRGKAIWTHEKKDGPEYIMYNQKPLYRYNSYCGVSTVHYMDLVEISEKAKLQTMPVALGAGFTRLVKGGLKTERQKVLKPWAEGLLNKINNLKFLSYIGENGFPEIIPVIQAQCADSTRIVFSMVPYGKELNKIPGGAHISVFGMTLDMEDILVEGIFKGIKRHGIINAGIIDIERVYNSMPPKQGYIYPEQRLEAVTEF